MNGSMRKCKLCKEQILRSPTHGNPKAAFTAAPREGAPWRSEGGFMCYRPGASGLGYDSHWRTCTGLDDRWFAA